MVSMQIEKGWLFLELKRYGLVIMQNEQQSVYFKYLELH